MVRGQFSGGRAVFLGGNCPMANCLESNCPAGNFPQGQLSLGAIVLGINCPGAIIRRAMTLRGQLSGGQFFSRGIVWTPNFSSIYLKLS